MRLLNVVSLMFEEFENENSVPKYATLSHRWLGRETTLRDFQERRHPNSDGHKKVETFAKYVREKLHAIKYVWIDSCCINKESSAELSESVNRMFDWYHHAEICIAYLADATTIDDLEASKWFRRGWTLQELLAPRTVVFVNKTWEVLGNKGASSHGYTDIECQPGLEKRISKVTGIPEQVLHHYRTSLSMSVGDRLKWMSGRETTRGEDLFYALYGIFRVAPGVNYGEGKAGARQRLMLAIREKESQTEAGRDPVARALGFEDADDAAEEDEGPESWETVDTSDSLLAAWTLHHGPDLQAKDQEGLTVLCYFARRGDVDVVRRLLGLGANIEALGREQRTPLHEASMQNKVGVAKLLLEKGANVHAVDSSQNTPLILTSRCGGTRIGELLLDHGAKIDACNRLRLTALHECCESEHARPEMASMLLRRGANFSLWQAYGYFPIHQATVRGHASLVRKLLDHGDDVNRKVQETKTTALHLACQHNHSEVVELLLSRAAVIEARDRNAHTPLHRASQSSAYGVVEMLLKAGADITVQTNVGYTSLHVASQNNNTTLIQLLLKYATESDGLVGMQQYRGSTALGLAAMHGCFPAVVLLLDAGHANINAKNYDGWTPLTEACFHGHLDVVRALVLRGARRDVPFHEGLTTREHAARAGHMDIVRFLDQTL